MDSFICANCGHGFSLPPAVRAKYPGWTPQFCSDCHGGPRRPAATLSLSRQETLERYQDGPQSGIFTDGFCDPNPGRGGWGAVKVVAGELVEERCGQEQQTTNNRVELRALIEGFKMVETNEGVAVYSDSELCVNTITKWASGWKKKGWKKKGGEIKNLDLVKELYELAPSRPKARLEWIRGHAGNRWNEYADALSRTPAETLTADG